MPLTWRLDPVDAHFGVALKESCMGVTEQLNYFRLHRSHPPRLHSFSFELWASISFASCVFGAGHYVTAVQRREVSPL